MSKLRHYSGPPNREFVGRAVQLVASSGSAELRTGICEEVDGTRVLRFGLAGPGANGGQTRVIAIYEEICNGRSACKNGNGCNQYLSDCHRALAEDISARTGLNPTLNARGDYIFAKV